MRRPDREAAGIGAAAARRAMAAWAGLWHVLARRATAVANRLHVSWLRSKARARHVARIVYYKLRPDDAILWQLRLAWRRAAALVRPPAGVPHGPSHKFYIAAPVRVPGATMADDEPLRFEPAERPAVSVVIPVFNKSDFTLRCLRSIARRRWRYPHEVIVVDDCSTDRTRALLASIEGLRLVANERNLGFVRSCNAGAREARGEYLLFLNNDTEVLPGWMDELVDTFVHRPDAGLAGSKLVYPDGRLQEAGGFVAQEGSGGNYGRNDDPNKPQYNFLRETDYCSGASIMVPRALFAQLGGFDERYAPAYYEDTDLAFAVRRAGRKVFYQPLSQLVHYEGVTSGTDPRRGVKSYQVENKRKFFERWRNELRTHGWPGTDHRREAERYVRKRALVVNTAAGVSAGPDEQTLALALARWLQSHSYQVTFVLRRDFSYVEEVIPALQRLGVECLYAPYATDLRRHLRRHGRRYDTVFQYRPNRSGTFVEEKELRRYCPDARLAFHTGDAASLRDHEQGLLE